jgi:hypothetical protein
MYKTAVRQTGTFYPAAVEEVPTRRAPKAKEAAVSTASTQTFSLADLTKRYQQITHSVTAECEFVTELVGGVPAKEEGVRAFVTHHLQLVGEEAEAAVQRILRDEIGERDTTPDGGEVQTKLTYGINVIRRDEHGPWVGDWMVR